MGDKTYSTETRLYNKYYHKHLCIVSRYIDCPFVAEEVCNDAFIKIFKCLGDYNGSGEFEGWMRKIVLHTIFDAIRSDEKILTKNWGVDGRVNLGSTVIKVHSDAEYNLGKEDIDIEIDKFPLIHKNVFRLYIEGYRHREISERLNITDGFSRWIVNRCKKRLWKLF